MAANNPDEFLQLFTANLERLGAKNANIERAIVEIRGKNGQLAQVIGQIRDAVGALTAQVAALAERIRAAQEEKARLEAEIARLRALPDQQAQVQQLQARVAQLTLAITNATPLIEQIGNGIDNLIRTANEEGITPEQIAAITDDIATIGEQTRLLSQMLPPPPANGQPPVDQIPPPANGEGRAGGGKKMKKTKKSKRRTRKMRKTKGRKQRGGYNWITPGSSSRGKSASSSSRTRNTKRRNKKSRSSL